MVSKVITLMMIMTTLMISLMMIMTPAIEPSPLCRITRLSDEESNWICSHLIRKIDHIDHIGHIGQILFDLYCRSDWPYLIISIISVRLARVKVAWSYWSHFFIQKSQNCLIIIIAASLADYQYCFIIIVIIVIFKAIGWGFYSYDYHCFHRVNFDHHICHHANQSMWESS